LALATGNATSVKIAVPDVPWNDTERAACDVAGGAHAAMHAIALSERLFMQDFAFDIPPTASVTSVAVTLHVSIDDPSPTANFTREEEIALIARGPGTSLVLWMTPIPDDRAGWAYAGTNVTYPRPSDDMLWGGAVATGADVGVPGFGVSVRISNVEFFGVTANVLCVSMAVEYVLAAPAPHVGTTAPRGEEEEGQTPSTSAQTLAYAIGFGGLGCLFVIPSCAWTSTRIRAYRRERAAKNAHHGPDVCVSGPSFSRRGIGDLVFPATPHPSSTIRQDDDNTESCGFTSSDVDSGAESDEEMMKGEGHAPPPHPSFFVRAKNTGKQ
jgi:hypothetical protein